MKSYKQLEREFNLEVEKLQKKCPHKRTKWYDEYWAVGHGTGKQIKVCLFCDKTLEKK